MHRTNDQPGIMTENEEKLLHRYLDGAISSEEFALLEELLRTDSEARRSLRTLATIDSKWQQLAADEEFQTDTVEPDISSIKRFWPMAAGIAALVVLGLFSLWIGIHANRNWCRKSDSCRRRRLGEWRSAIDQW